MVVFDKYKKKGEWLIETFLAEAKDCFSLDDVQRKLKVSRDSASMILSRLKKKRQIISLSQGVYAYFPPVERKSGFDVSKVLSSIMRHWGSPHYVGLLTAADYYGAAHYKPQVLQVMIPKALGFRKAKSLGLEFHVQKHFPKEGITKIKTPAGYVPYSAPELLVLDLIEYEKASGGFDNVALVIKDILLHLKSADLQKIALQYPVMAAVQRLGFILEFFGGEESLLLSLQRVMKKRGASIVALSSLLPKKGKYDPKWRIIKNTTLEEIDDF